MTSKSLLIVEDNPDDLELALRAFRKNGLPYDIHVARDGAEALERLLGSSAARTALPSLVLLDLHMPGVDGLTVLRRIRADSRTALLPVVILTTSDERGDVLDSYRSGANSFVRKPTTFDDLVRRIEQLTDYWLGLNQGPTQPQAIR